MTNPFQIDTDALWIDARQPEEYASGSVPQAINIPHDQLMSRLNEVDAEDDQMICVFCLGGKRAAMVKQALEQDGYTNVINLGGIQDALAHCEQE